MTSASKARHGGRLTETLTETPSPCMAPKTMAIGHWQDDGL